MSPATTTPVSQLRAVAHPVRLRMLSLMTGTALSAADLARELGISHANASYHLRQLVDAGEVVEAGEVKIRGGVAKRYRYPHEADSRHHDPTTEERLLYARALFTEVQRRLPERVGGPGQSSDLEGWVEHDTWARAVALMEEASRLLHDANRPPQSPDTVHVSFTAMLFRMAPT